MLGYLSFIHHTTSFMKIILSIMLLLSAADSTTYMFQMTGGLPVNEIAAAFTFAFLGVVLMTAFNVRNGIVNNPHTSHKFTLKDFGWSTFIRVLCSLTMSLITVFVVVRFAHVLMKEVPALAQFGLMGFSFFVGLGLDRWTQKLVSKGASKPDTDYPNKP